MTDWMLVHPYLFFILAVYFITAVGLSATACANSTSERKLTTKLSMSQSDVEARSVTEALRKMAN